MLFIVKNTTFCSISDLVCPHTCRCCGELGSILCDRCKKDMYLEHENYCLNCKREIYNGICSECNLPPTYMIGWKDEIVGKLVHDFKYNSVMSIGNTFADILDRILPYIDGKVVIVPLPTIKKHVRERGFDHTYCIAKKLAKKRGWSVQKLLKRSKNTVQVGTDMNTRIWQASHAYDIDGKIDPSSTYVLFDDVWTTGASMRAALKKLLDNGALKIIISVLAVSRIGKN